MAARYRFSLHWAAVAVAACSSPDASESPAPAEIRIAEPEAEPEPKLPVIVPFDTQGDEARALSDIGALPAWDAVVARDRFLLRRGDHGIVYGRIGRHDGAWYLHDETSPSLCLGYPFEPPRRAPIAAGDRVVAWGAWTVTSDSRWQWKATRIEKLESSGAPPPDHVPLAIQTADAVPEEAAVPSKRDGAGPIVFYVLAQPPGYGRGWPIADAANGARTARLRLPGEVPPYGGQMPPAPAETWQLAPGTRYTVQVARFRRRDGQLPAMRATTAPQIVPDAAE